MATESTLDRSSHVFTVWDRRVSVAGFSYEGKKEKYMCIYIFSGDW